MKLDCNSFGFSIATNSALAEKAEEYQAHSLGNRLTVGYPPDSRSTIKSRSYAKSALQQLAGFCLLFAVYCNTPAMAVPLPAGALTSHAELGSGRPKGCPSKWCGCWLGRKLGEPSKALWRAREWASWGRPSSLVPGAIMVMPNHVGRMLGWCDKAKGTVLLESGNTQGGKVGIGCFPVRKAIAFREKGGRYVERADRKQSLHVAGGAVVKSRLTTRITPASDAPPPRYKTNFGAKR